MIITVQDVRREGGKVVATVVDGDGSAELRFTGPQAATIASEWDRAGFDRSLYAALPPGFPAPMGIPVEI